MLPSHLTNMPIPRSSSLLVTNLQVHEKLPWWMFSFGFAFHTRSFLGSILVVHSITLFLTAEQEKNFGTIRNTTKYYRRTGRPTRWFRAHAAAHKTDHPRAVVDDNQTRTAGDVFSQLSNPRAQ